MSIAKTIELSTSSTVSFDDAIKEGIARADKTLNNIEGAWIKDQKVIVKSGKVVEYRVHMMVTFVLE